MALLGISWHGDRMGSGGFNRRNEHWIKGFGTVWQDLARLDILCNWRERRGSNPQPLP